MLLILLHSLNASTIYQHTYLKPSLFFYFFSNNRYLLWSLISEHRTRICKTNKYYFLYMIIAIYSIVLSQPDRQIVIVLIINWIFHQVQAMAIINLSPIFKYYNSDWIYNLIDKLQDSIAFYFCLDPNNSWLWFQFLKINY